MVDDAVREQISRGTIYSVNHELELELAEALCRHIPVRRWFAMPSAAVKHARSPSASRGVTGRRSRAVLWLSRLARLVSGSEPERKRQDSMRTYCRTSSRLAFLVDWPAQPSHSLMEMQRPSASCSTETAGRSPPIIMEPLRSELPPEGYLAAVRKLATEHGAVLIFDEVLGRLAVRHGRSCKVRSASRPDMAVFAKSISNGYTDGGAIVGRREVMEPAAQMFISSTYWSDTIGLRAVLTTLEEAERRGVASQLEEFGAETESPRLPGDRRRSRSGSRLPRRRCPSPPRLRTGRSHAHGDRQDALHPGDGQRGCHGNTAFYLNAAQGDAELEQTAAAAREVFTVRSRWPRCGAVSPSFLNVRHSMTLFAGWCVRGGHQDAIRELVAQLPLEVVEHGLVFDAAHEEPGCRVACFTSLCRLAFGERFCADFRTDLGEAVRPSAPCD